VKKKLSITLVAVISVLLIALPAMGKAGRDLKGNSSSNGNAGGKSATSQSSTNNISKSDKGSSSSQKMNTSAGQSQKGQNAQSSGQLLKNKSDQQISAVKQKLQQKKSQVAQKNFSDTGKHWSKANVEKVQSLGLMSGYIDSSFKPDAPITSVEAMVIAVNMATLVDTGTETTASENTDTTVGSTTDADGTEIPAWAKAQAQKAAKLKVVNMNRFHSSVQATRAQTAVMLAKALSLAPVDTSVYASVYSFSDSVLISSEDLGYIMALREAGIVFGNPDGKFNPNSSITRAEVASMLTKTVENIEAGDGTTADATAAGNTGTGAGSGTTGTGTGSDTGNATGSGTTTTTTTPTTSP